MSQIPNSRPWLLVALLAVAGCELWRPPLPTDAQLEHGLIVLYPGATNSSTEMVGYHEALRAAGFQQAIEVVPWSPPLLYFFNPAAIGDWIRPWAKSEAARIAAFQDEHPGATIVLLGYSGGALAATEVAEEFPDGRAVDCVVLMSPGMPANYDLTRMLNHTRGGCVAYSSPQDLFAIVFLASYQVLDVSLARPAATFGFDLVDPRLRQVRWSTDLIAYGNAGDHIEYLGNVTWLRDALGEWLRHDP